MFQIKENGVKYELSFAEGYSAGLFLDQRDNRRRFLVNHVAAGFPLFEDAAAPREVLNTFALDFVGESGLRFSAPPGEDAAAWKFALFAPLTPYRLAVAAPSHTSSGRIVARNDEDGMAIEPLRPESPGTLPRDLLRT